jgi:hypothetical protein
LVDDRRMSPLEALRRLVKQIEAGEVVPDRMVLVLTDRCSHATHPYVYGAGPGVNTDPVIAAGMLAIGLTRLHELTSGDDAA